ncbi:MAG: alpha/beta hydrolase [Burkholderiales bacterium]|nr:MAG: alpha/beta hydrolase [Burkholderiales bacterium]
MPTAAVNGLTIDYAVHGAWGAQPLLAIMGLGMPAAAWPPALIDLLVGRGARVITFDNRDAGGSTTFSGAAAIPLAVAIARAALKLHVPAPYTLHDMAADAVGLLDALGVSRAHVVGVSMGGMIAQLLAAKYPQRVASLTSIMSSTGNPSPRVAWGEPRAIRAILRRPEDPRDLQSVVDSLERKFSVIGTPMTAQERAAQRPHYERIARRGLDTAAARRQLLAVLATGDRRQWLRRIDAPTLVLHGRLDPLLPVAAGIETAQCIAGARLVVIEGMGHDLPPALLPRLADEIASIADLPGRPGPDPGR